MKVRNTPIVAHLKAELNLSKLYWVTNSPSPLVPEPLG